MSSHKPYFTHNTHPNDRDVVTSTTNYSGQLKRYFSSLDAEVYIGGERILDIVRIDFSYEEKKMPFYGFNSFWPSRVFTGQKIIQGTFVINFTEPGYIAKLLQKIKSSDLEEKTELVGRSCSEENAPLFAKAFDILIGYGGYQIEKEVSYKNTYQILQGVHVNGYQQILDTSGEPVLEVYSFIAKNLKFGGYKFENLNNNNHNSNNNDSDSSGSSFSEFEIVEKRLKSEVQDLADSCNRDNKLLGIIVDTYHSLHKTNKKSHIYVEFPQLINAEKGDRITGGVTLTIHDNEVNISETYHLNNRSGNQFGVLINEEQTKLFKKKLTGNSQKLVSCSLQFDFIRNGEKHTGKKQVYMRQGANY